MTFDPTNTKEWQRSGSLVFLLEESARNRGKSEFRNKYWFHVHGAGPEVHEGATLIAKKVCQALNQVISEETKSSLELWTTLDGCHVRLRDMTDDHLLNSKNFVVTRLANGDFEEPHICPVVDIGDGPCADCHDDIGELRREKYEMWLIHFRNEMERRKLVQR